MLFFVLDIPKCWKMVSGKTPAGRIKTAQADETGTAGECGVTLPLGDRTENMHDRTAAICGEAGEGTERTMPLDTGMLEMELIQDIVYVQEEES